MYCSKCSLRNPIQSLIFWNAIFNDIQILCLGFLWWTMLASHQNRSPRIFNEFCLFFFIISTNNNLIQDILIYFFNFEELCWNPHVHTTKGKNGVWCRNTLEIGIFRNPIEWSICTRNDRDARLAERCLLLGEMEYIVTSYSLFLHLPWLSCPVKTVCQITEVKLSDHS